ncbi:plasmid mobilization relaxosome protein MobC [Shewanella sp. 202IG2-18]|uniref:plasmid mobilization protein n=1 Tax=Parashewanella hymeniacidonis TaxID=2807618 RepID=UPI001960261E|nr:plasmid mobilization relaxosome protein MobC [Parashewanella hymeniacidonis]MBM7072421.1 plasmid mobilization relaxosome protein MobC [Parashewanella hymeniacidonis]
MGDNIVKTRLSDNEKLNWQQFCKDSGMSQSNMLRMMINKVTPEAGNDADINELKTDRVSVRLTNHCLQKLQQQAIAEGYVSQSNWVRASIMSNLYRDPVLSDDEIKTLRESNRELAAVGRNLNQIARVLNIDFRHSDKITREMIEILDNKINDHKAMVNNLINKNCRRWELEQANE